MRRPTAKLRTSARSFDPRRCAAACTVAILTTSALLTVATAGAEPQGVEYGPLQSGWAAAHNYSIAHPDALPIGMNNYGCEPTAAHPHPVVLVNGSFLNSYANWAMYSPQLAADGYCVFGLDYGGTGFGPYFQTGDMRDSAAELGGFIDDVLARTGADKVDIVGYSQGGMVPYYYMNRLGGADKVDTMVGLAAPVSGSAGYGVLTALTTTPGISAAIASTLPAVVDGTAGSEFIDEMSAGGITRPGVRYVTVSSNADLVVPLQESELPPAPNVTNVVVQDACPDDHVFHGSVIYDDITLRLVRNALDPGTAVPPSCHLVLPG